MSQRRDGFAQAIPSYTSDAFDRQRTSTPDTLFDSKHSYGLNTDASSSEGVNHWCYIESGGQATYSGSDATVNLTTDLNSGSSVTKQTREYLPYFPGKSHLVQMTGVPIDIADTSNIHIEIGLGDSRNGAFYTVQSGGNWGVIVRSDASGSVVDEVVMQNSWNCDALDGTMSKRNPSRIGVDPMKSQIFAMDMQMLYSGSVRFGFMLNGSITGAHEQHHANILNIPYIRSSSLPLRYHIENKGTLTNTPTLKSICATLISEGGADIGGPTFDAGNHEALITGIGTRRPIASVKLKNDYNGRENRIISNFLSGEFYSEDKTTLVEVVQVTGTWSDHGATYTDVQSRVSASEFSVDITNFSGGHEHHLISTFVPAAKGGKGFSSASDRTAQKLRDPFYKIVQNPASDFSEIFVVYATGIGGNSSASSIIRWEEVQ